MTTENNPRRIAVLHAAPCTGSYDYLKRLIPNHYRYTLFERRERTGRHDTIYDRPEVITHSKILLRYEDLSIEEFIARCRHSIRVNRGLVAFTSPVIPLPGNDVAINVSLSIDGQDRIIARFLGVIDGYHCYVMFKESYLTNRQVPYHFSLRSVPDHGMANVVYQVDTARDSFKRPNITQTHVTAEDGYDELALFDKMDALIAPIMAPMVALLAPPKED